MTVPLSQDKLLAGKPLAALIRASIKELIAEYRLQPRMLLIQAGTDPASAFYVQNIVDSGSKLGCEVNLLTLPESVSQPELLDLVQKANTDSATHGIMVQRPLPKGIDDHELACEVDPGKDIDCLNPVNLGNILLERDCLLPCTPLAVLCTLIHYQIPAAGRNVVIIGRSAVVGKPLANMLLWKKPYANASVTVCHSRSVDLPEFTRSADILIAAMGVPAFVKAHMVKPGSVLIDVGINPVNRADGKVGYVGDIDFEPCLEKASAITPVPGGIGTITTSLLFLNLVRAALAQGGTNKNIDDFLGLIFRAVKNDFIP